MYIYINIYTYIYNYIYMCVWFPKVFSQGFLPHLFVPNARIWSHCPPPWPWSPWSSVDTWAMPCLAFLEAGWWIVHISYIMCIIYIYKHGCVCVDRYSCIIYIFTDRHIDRQIALNSHVLFGGSPEEKIKAAAEAVKNQTKALRLTSGDLWIPPGSTWIHSHNYGTSPFLIGKPSINGPCSMENHHFYGKSSFW